MLRVSIFNNQSKKIIKWPLAALLICVVFSLGLAAFYGVVFLAKPVSANSGAATVITVEPGMNAKDIGRKLQDKGLIRNLTVFQIAAKIERLDSSLKAGDYSLHPGMSVNEIIAIISEGRTTFEQFTIPEGYTVEQIAALLGGKNLADGDRFKALAKNYAPHAYMRGNAATNYESEGFLFPDTYRVAADVNEEQLLAMMVNQFDKSFTREMRERADNLALSPHEVITLASLVEKEAMLAEDRPVIAAVFLKRLEQEIPLQSCATIQYILGCPKAELTVADTQIPSPYNTYQNMGLPPGPIANPGKAAIEAVLENQETEHLYFVADKKGRHHFSPSYAEHLEKIALVEAGYFDEK